MIEARWNLKTYLQAHNLTPYRLARALPDMRQATIYRLVAQDSPQSVSFDILARVISGLRALTGEEVTPNDLITLVSKMDDEDAAWLSADLSGLAHEEPYDWGGLDPLSLGQPVSVNDAGEMVVGER